MTIKIDATEWTNEMRQLFGEQMLDKGYTPLPEGTIKKAKHFYLADSKSLSWGIDPCTFHRIHAKELTFKEVLGIQYKDTKWDVRHWSDQEKLDWASGMEKLAYDFAGTKSMEALLQEENVNFLYTTSRGLWGFGTSYEVFQNTDAEVGSKEETIEDLARLLEALEIPVSDIIAEVKEAYRCE